MKPRSKRDLRASLLDARAALPAATRCAYDAAIGVGVLAWLARHPTSVLGVYWPIRHEPDLAELYAQLTLAGVHLALPVMSLADAPLVFAEWTPGAAMSIDRWGIATPSAITLATPQALLIPCVGFDARGFRLGYGAGHYDRTLAQTPRPQAIGIAYSLGRAQFDVEPHDQAMDDVITEVAPGAAPGRLSGPLPSPLAGRLQSSTPE